jgi:FkbM family methyltransferase
MTTPTQFYGQRQEDRFAFHYLMRFPSEQLTKTFLDIGSYDGRHLSNSLVFENLGWRGICVEADPAAFKSLVKNRKCICVNVACSDREGSIEFYAEADRPMGTTNSIAAEKLKTGWNFKAGSSQHIPARTVDSILREYGFAQIDFVSIDVDGGEVDVLNGFNLSLINPKLVCIETNHKEVKAGKWPREHVEEIDRIMRSHGYRHLKYHGANSFYSKDRFPWLIRLQLIDLPWRGNSLPGLPLPKRSSSFKRIQILHKLRA